MATVENLDEEKNGDESEDIDSLENQWNEIPEGLPGSRNPRKRPESINYSRAESIDIDNPQRVYKRRGRPPGSTGRTSAKTTATNVEKFWIDLTALGLNITTAFLAARILHDRKYIMAKDEAAAAGKAIMLVAFKYKAFRDVAVVINSENDWAIIAKGFWPYLSRVLVKEIIDDILLRLFVSGPGRNEKGRAGNVNTRPNANTGTNEQRTNGNSTGSNDGRINGSDGIAVPFPVDGSIDWRAL